MFALIARLPQPLKTLYVLWPVAVAAGVITVITGSERASYLVGGVLGLLAVVIGLLLAADFRGSAGVVAESARSYRFLGVGRSPALLGSARFTRFFGAMLAAIGVLFVIVGIVNLFA